MLGQRSQLKDTGQMNRVELRNALAALCSEPKQARLTCNVKIDELCD